VTYLDYLKDELKHRYSNHLAGPIFLGLFLFFSKASYLMIFLYSVGLFIGALILSAYTKTFYRKI